MATKKPMLRTRILILPQFQLRLVGANVLVMLIASLAIWTAVSSSFSDLQALVRTVDGAGDFYSKQLAFQASNVKWTVFLGLLGGVLVSSFLSLYISFRFAGPMIRMRNYFQGISKNADSPLPRLNFRQNDFLQELPPIVNKAMDSIEQSRQKSDAA